MRKFKTLPIAVVTIRAPNRQTTGFVGYPSRAYYSGRGWAARPIVASPLFSNAWPR
jgi:hypothetical protein